MTQYNGLDGVVDECFTVEVQIVFSQEQMFVRSANIVFGSGCCGNMVLVVPGSHVTGEPSVESCLCDCWVTIYLNSLLIIKEISHDFCPQA